MLKHVLIFVAFAVAYTSAAAIDASPSDDAHAKATVQSSDVRGDGFDTALDTTNSIHSVRHGDAKGNIEGEFSWQSPKGEVISVKYVADENGYQPQSDSLPVAPPVPEAILKSLEYIRAHPPKENN